MKEKEIVQDVRDTDPEMKELWPMVEEVLDEMEAVKLREPGLIDQINGLSQELSEFKQNSRRIVAFHKDLGLLKSRMKHLDTAEDPEYNAEYTRYEEEMIWVEGYKGSKYQTRKTTSIKAPPGMYFSDRYYYADRNMYGYADHGGPPRLLKRPAPGSVRKVQEAYERLKKKTSELLKQRKKTDPLLKEPMYKVVLQRLAGKTFTALEGARVGYQVQLERGQRPTSQSARLKKSMDVRNFESQLLDKVKKGLKYNSDGTYTLDKDYTLKSKALRPSGDVLIKMKKDLGEAALKCKAIQDRVGTSKWYENDELREAHHAMTEISCYLSGPSYDAALRDVGLKWCSEHGLQSVEK
jgi:hypothetical protein